jgi:hypothetical protein
MILFYSPIRRSRTGGGERSRKLAAESNAQFAGQPHVEQKSKRGVTSRSTAIAAKSTSEVQDFSAKVKRASCSLYLSLCLGGLTI